MLQSATDSNLHGAFEAAVFHATYLLSDPFSPDLGMLVPYLSIIANMRAEIIRRILARRA